MSTSVALPLTDVRIYVKFADAYHDDFEVILYFRNPHDCDSPIHHVISFLYTSCLYIPFKQLICAAGIVINTQHHCGITLDLIIVIVYQ